MRELATALRAEVEAAGKLLRRIPEAEAARDRGEGRWRKKEILGHLIDSAVNNAARFVRAQAGGDYVGPGYEQERWVAANGYRERPWDELVDLWVALNGHVAHVVERVPEERLATRCTVADQGPETLEWFIRDYVRHLRQHLAQIVHG